MSQGIFIALESADSRALAIQLKLLTERLKAIGHDVVSVDFPLDTPSSWNSYIEGKFGSVNSISPYTGALLAAADHYSIRKTVDIALQKGSIVLTSNYVGACMAHEGTKFSAEDQQHGFFIWLDNMEYQLLGSLRPTRTLIVGGSDPRSSKSSISSLTSTYSSLSSLFSKDFTLIEGTEKGRSLSIPAVNNRLWAQLQDLLPSPPKGKAMGRQVHLPHLPVEVPELVVNSSKVHDGSKIKIETSLLAALHLMSRRELSKKLVWNGENSNSQSNEGFKFFTPPAIEKNAKLSKFYTTAMNKLADLYNKMEPHLTGHFMRNGLSPNKSKSRAKQYLYSVMPLAAISIVEISSRLEEVQSAAKSLTANNLVEVSRQATNLLIATGYSAKKPVRSKPSELGEIVKDLNQSLAMPDEMVKLRAFTPMNEISLLPTIIFPESGQSMEVIEEEVDNWSYSQKSKLLSSYAANSNSNSALENINYEWEVTSDSVSVLEFMSLCHIDTLSFQAPSPRYGYEVPEEIELSGAEELYIECFDISLELYSKLQEAGLGRESSYATLAGHRICWSAKYNALSAQKLDTDLDSKPLSYRNLIESMKEKRSEIHPIISSIEMEILEVATKPAEQRTSTNRAQSKPEISVARTTATKRPRRRSRSRRKRTS